MSEAGEGRRGWRRLWRGAVVLYALYMFALVAFYMFIAGRSVSYSYTISGQPEVVVGQPAALRLGVYDIYRGRFLPGAQVEVDFVQGQGAPRRVFSGRTSPVGLGDVNVAVPQEAAPGPAQWRVRLQPVDMAQEEVDIPVQVQAPASGEALVDAWNEAAATIEELSSSSPQKESAPLEGEGPLRLELVADGHSPVDGLKSVFFVHASRRDTGAPVRTAVDLEILKGLVDGGIPKSVKTDEGGLGFFTAVPIGSQRWKLSARSQEEGGEQLSTRELVIKSELTQHSLRLDSPVWGQDQALRAQVTSLRRGGVVYGDIYQGERWAWGQVTGLGASGAGFAIPDRAVVRPAAGVELVRFQVYADALQPGKAGDVRYLAVPAAGVEEDQVLAALQERAAQVGVLEEQARAARGGAWWVGMSQHALRRHIAFWLAQLPRELHQPPLLKDTQDGQKAELEQEKDGARRDITGLLVVSGGLGLLLVLYLVVSNLLRVRREGREALAEVAQELDPEEAAALLGETRGLARAEALIQLVFLFATVAVFFGAIVVLLQFL